MIFGVICVEQGCTDPDPDPCFFGQKDPDPFKLTDPYGSGSVPRIRKILIKNRDFFAILLTK